MKRFIFAMLMVLAIGPAIANADTVDLYATSGFGNLHQYHNVQTNLCVPYLDLKGNLVSCQASGLVTIYLPASTTQHSIQLYFGDQVNPVTYYFYSYWIGTYSGNGLVSILQKCVFPMDPTNSYSTGPCALDGEVIQVTLNETSRVVRGGGSGRGGYASHTVWTLLDGTIVR